MILLASCAGFVAALGYGAEGYVNLGGPIPATRAFVLAEVADLKRSVDEQLSDASNHRDDIASFSKETRALLLQREYNTALERIMDLEKKVWPLPDSYGQGSLAAARCHQCGSRSLIEPRRPV